MLAVTPADPDYVYALEGDNGGFGNLYLSENGGQTFSVQSNNATNDNNIMGYVKTVRGGQAPRDMDVVVSPLDKNEVHIGGIMSYRSFDAGVNWEQTSHWLTYDPLPFIHADIDIIQYVGNRMYFGTDGGIFVSEDKASSFIDKTAGLSIRQFYRFAISEDGNLLVAGSQDNGMSLHTEERGWVDFIGADGMIPIIDRYNNDNIYASIQYGFLYKTADGGYTRVGGVYASPGTGEWVTPIVQDPLVPHTFYQGKQQLHKTIDSTQNWFPISNFVPNNPADTTMQEIAIAHNDNDYIIVGYEEQAYKTIDGGANWTEITPPFGFLNINYIALHPHDKNWITMALSGTDSRVVQSTDGGENWTDIMDNLPELAAECVIYEGGPKNGMYVGMDPGVYYRNSDHSQWALVSQGMPNILVSEMRIHDCELYVATYGRGIWKTGLLDNSQVYADQDNDGYGDDSSAIPYCNSQPGYIATAGDCDDTNPLVHPARPELCNSIDDNCNGLTDALDAGLAAQVMTWYRDADGDGQGDPIIYTEDCDRPDGYVLNSDDCNDSDRTIGSGFLEFCDGLDNDCNGTVDDIRPEDAAELTWYKDEDGDGDGDISSIIIACLRPSGYSENNYDCDDTDASIHSSAIELCDNKDNNCNGIIDDVGETGTWYRDNDGDGYGDPLMVLGGCSQPAGYVANNSDCDDFNAAVFLGAVEICDGLDNDCSGTIDDLPEGSAAAQNWYKDADGDGEGNLAIIVTACSPPEGYVANSTDCNDNNADISSSAIEICDGLDNDCNGAIDDVQEGSEEAQLWYRDADGDGEGNLAVTMTACSSPPGYVANSTDCNDNNAAISSSALESCDGLDNDCNGTIDDLPVGSAAMQLWYRDADGDGEGDSSVSISDCTQPEGYVANGDDCDDSDTDTNSSAQELCDGIDNNCDGEVDEDCDMVDCDGNFLFIRNSFQDEYHAGITLFSNAVLNSDGATQTFAAGYSIDLLPGFEVEQGKVFEAIIKPCNNGVSPVQRTLTNELAIIDKDLKARISAGELVRVEIVSVSASKLYKVVFTKSAINLRYMLSQLPSDRYVLFVESKSLQWNREFDVITDQTD